MKKYFLLIFVLYFCSRCNKNETIDLKTWKYGIPANRFRRLNNIPLIGGRGWVETPGDLETPGDHDTICYNWWNSYPKDYNGARHCSKTIWVIKN